MEEMIKGYSYCGFVIFRCRRCIPCSGIANGDRNDNHGWNRIVSLGK